MSIALTLVGNKSQKLLHDASLKHLLSQRHSLTLSLTTVSILLFDFAHRPNSSISLEHRKKIGVLPAFDPSAPNVHPDSRPKVFIKISMKQRRTLNRHFKQRRLSVGSLSNEEWEGDLAEGDDISDLTHIDNDSSLSSSSSRWISNRRSTLRSHRGRTDLPFSPGKMRLRRRALSDSESSEMAVSDDVGPTRRSNRIRNSRRINAVDHDFEDDEWDTLSDEGVTPIRNSRSKSKPNIPKRGKASRAAYGHIRSIADLEYDELENGPLSTHRHTCERCQRKATHVLLNQQRKSAKRRKPKDGSEEDSDSEDKLAGLGGWVQW